MRTGAICLQALIRLPSVHSAIADSLTRLPDRHDIDRLEKAAEYYQPGDASDILAVAAHRQHSAC